MIPFWWVEKNADPTGPPFIILRDGNEGHEYVAECYTEKEANLIVAAPEMLAALRAILGYLARGVPLSAQGEMTKMVREAISNAEGK